MFMSLAKEGLSLAKKIRDKLNNNLLKNLPSTNLKLEDLKDKLPKVCVNDILCSITMRVLDLL